MESILRQSQFYNIRFTAQINRSLYYYQDYFLYIYSDTHCHPRLRVILTVDDTSYGQNVYRDFLRVVQDTKITTTISLYSNFTSTSVRWFYLRSFLQMSSLSGRWKLSNFQAICYSLQYTLHVICGSVKTLVIKQQSLLATIYVYCIGVTCTY